MSDEYDERSERLCNECNQSKREAILLRAEKAQLQDSLDYINDACLAAEAERDGLRREVERLRTINRLQEQEIGDVIRRTHDDLEAAVDEQKKLGQISYDAQRAEIATLKAKLAEAEMRGMEMAIIIVRHGKWVDDASGSIEGKIIRAIRAKMEKMPL